MNTWGETIEFYRAKYSTDKYIILRPANYSFVESTSEEMNACLDELERAVFLSATLGEKLSPLQNLALELVMPEALQDLRKKTTA